MKTSPVSTNSVRSRVTQPFANINCSATAALVTVAHRCAAWSNLEGIGDAPRYVHPIAGHKLLALILDGTRQDKANSLPFAVKVFCDGLMGLPDGNKELTPVKNEWKLPLFEDVGHGCYRKKLLKPLRILVL